MGKSGLGLSSIRSERPQGRFDDDDDEYDGDDDAEDDLSDATFPQTDFACLHRIGPSPSRRHSTTSRLGLEARSLGLPTA